MILEQTITWLEMTSPEELRPGRVPPAPVELVAADRSRLHTSSSDHALPNYLGRGFRVVRTEVRRKHVPAAEDA
jgi:hypothetical protein